MIFIQNSYRKLSMLTHLAVHRQLRDILNTKEHSNGAAEALDRKLHGTKG